jgi:tRNA(Ile)-lysidine synthase
VTRLEQQVRRTILRHDLCPAGTRIIVGISGGSDSVALTLLLRDLAGTNGFAVVSLAHLNHRLRDAASRDEAFCRDFAFNSGLPIVVEDVDVKSHATVRGLSVEDAARQLRYDFLGRAAAAAGATRVAVGHTQDDQAETLLLKLMRGAGLTGLAGIHPRRGMVVRPLLDVSRADLRTYLTERGQPWIEDETNEALGNPRNRIRHVVLPELDRAAGASTRPALARAAARLRDDGLWLDALSRERFAALAAPTPEGLELHVSALAVEPLPVRSRLLLEALRQTSGGKEIGLEHVEAVTALLSCQNGGIDVPGARVELRRGKLVLIRQKGSAK